MISEALSKEEDLAGDDSRAEGWNHLEAHSHVWCLQWDDSKIRSPDWITFKEPLQVAWLPHNTAAPG